MISSQSTFRPLGGLLLTGTVSLMVALIILFMFPYYGISVTSDLTYYLPGEQARLFLMTVAIGVVVMLVNSFLSVVHQMRISPIQASLVMLRTLYETQGREQRLIEKRLNRLRKREQKKGVS